MCHQRGYAARMEIFPSIIGVMRSGCHARNPLVGLGRCLSGYPLDSLGWVSLIHPSGAACVLAAQHSVMRQLED